MNEITFNIKCTMRESWASHFLGMLKQMQYLGAIGSSRYVTIFSDGDGSFRPKFEIVEACSKEYNGPFAEPAKKQGGHTLFDTG